MGVDNPMIKELNSATIAIVAQMDWILPGSFFLLRNNSLQVRAGSEMIWLDSILDLAINGYFVGNQEKSVGIGIVSILKLF
jgi:hypothetical protein